MVITATVPVSAKIAIFRFCVRSFTSGFKVVSMISWMMLIAPPCGYQGVYLRAKVNSDQGHCACISQSCRHQVLCEVCCKWLQDRHNDQLDDVDCTTLWLPGAVSGDPS